MMSDMLLKDLGVGGRQELRHREHSAPLPSSCTLATKRSCSPQARRGYSQGGGPKHRASVPTRNPKLTGQEAKILTSVPRPCP